jgi:hypothetical protein
MNKNIIWVLVAVIVIAAVILGVMVMTKPSQLAISPGGQASLTLANMSGGAVEVGDIQHVRWTSSNYAAPTVSVDIIRKVGENPARYSLVRRVSAATKNDGDAVWVPSEKDAGTGIFVEVGCAPSAQACAASPLGGALAVNDTGKYANTAAAYEAIEQLNNK